MKLPIILASVFLLTACAESSDQAQLQSSPNSTQDQYYKAQWDGANGSYLKLWHLSKGRIEAITNYAPEAYFMQHLAIVREQVGSYVIEGDKLVIKWESSTCGPLGQETLNLSDITSLEKVEIPNLLEWYRGTSLENRQIDVNCDLFL